MRTPSPARTVVAGWAGLTSLVALSTGAVWLLALRLLDVAPRSTGELATVRVEQWVELAVLACGVVVGLWMLVGSLAGIGCAALARRRNAPASLDALGTWAPAVVRRLARGAVGLGVGAGLVLTPVAATADDTPPADVAVVELGWQSTAASAEPVDTTDTPDPVETATVEVTGSPGQDAPTDEAALEPERDVEDPTITTDGQQAERPLEAHRVSRTVPADDDPGAPVEVVVVRGDTLWDIAARALPSGASDADILRETVRWHEANADVVSDPDLILPGQVLRSP